MEMDKNGLETNDLNWEKANFNTINQDLATVE